MNIFEKIRQDLEKNKEKINEAYQKKAEEEKLYALREQIERKKERLRACGISYEIYKQAMDFKFLDFYYTKNGKTKKSKEKLQTVVSWWKHLKHEYPFLILYGEKGTGKTKLAQKLAVAGFENFKNVYYSDRKKLDLKLYDFDNLQEFIEFLQEVKLLIIDDFFTGYQTDYKFAQLYSVLDYRYQENKWTILTMNEDIRKLREKEITSGAEKDLILLADRLTEKGLFVYFDYPSLRDPTFKKAAMEGDIRHLQKSKKENFSMDI